MKKRILALILCLVMTVSLLPISAAAYTPVDMMGWINGIENNGIYCKEASFTVDCPESYSGTVKVSLSASGSSTELMPVDGQYKITEPLDSILVDIHFGSIKISYLITINSDHTWDVWTSNGDGSHSRSCGNGCGTSETEGCVDANPVDCKCDDCGASMHDWRFTKTDSTLTATCKNCSTPPLSVTLKADSVTLPTSPFNARLEGLEQFKKEVPNAVIGEFVYKYKGPDGWSVVAPTAANAKAGEYQVGVRISGLPNKEYGPVAMSLDDEVIPDGAGYEDLYVRYTAADPAVTAQTGDNRPIELMMVGVVVFSVLAAAAFILDRKRKYQQ